MRTTQLKTKQNKTVFQKNLRMSFQLWCDHLSVADPELPRRGMSNLKLGAPTYCFCHIFPKKCMEMKKKLDRGAHVSLPVPLPHRIRQWFTLMLFWN